MTKQIYEPLNQLKVYNENELYDMKPGEVRIIKRKYLFGLIRIGVLYKRNSNWVQKIGKPTNKTLNKILDLLKNVSLKYPISAVDFESNHLIYVPVNEGLHKEIVINYISTGKICIPEFTACYFDKFLMHHTHPDFESSFKSYFLIFNLESNGKENLIYTLVNNDIPRVLTNVEINQEILESFYLLNIRQINRIKKDASKKY